MMEKRKFWKRCQEKIRGIIVNHINVAVEWGYSIDKFDLWLIIKNIYFQVY